MFRILRPYLDMDTGPWIAGGSVRKAIMNEMYEGGDIDIFVPSQSVFFDLEKRFRAELGAPHTSTSASTIGSVMKTATLIYQFCEKSKYEAFPGFCNFELDGIGIPVQVIYFKTYSSAKEMIDSFDFTLCGAVTDGKNWIADARMQEDARDGVLRFSREGHFGGSVARVAKYTLKSAGYRPAPGLLRTALRADDFAAMSKLVNNDLFLEMPQCIYDKEMTLV
jgi:hypothetical protein